MCGESWHAIKGSRPSSQGWAPGVLPLCVCACVCVCVFGGLYIFLYLDMCGGLVGKKGGLWVLSLLSSFVFYS